jgi:methylmalonyl-CoA/ethylmalonyl-CoA epimerase
MIGRLSHVGVATPSIEASARLYRDATILGPPRIGAHGTPVIFVHPKDMGGVLVKLMQVPERRRSGVLSEFAEAGCEH